MSHEPRLPTVLDNFLLLDHNEQVAAIRRLAAQGWSDSDVSRLTGLHVVEIRRAIAPGEQHEHD